jgi:hypothetical protein
MSQFYDELFGCDNTTTFGNAMYTYSNDTATAYVYSGGAAGYTLTPTANFTYLYGRADKVDFDARSDRRPRQLNAEITYTLHGSPSGTNLPFIGIGCQNLQTINGTSRHLCAFVRHNLNTDKVMPGIIVGINNAASGFNSMWYYTYAAEANYTHGSEGSNVITANITISSLSYNSKIRERVVFNMVDEDETLESVYEVWSMNDLGYSFLNGDVCLMLAGTGNNGAGNAGVSVYRAAIQC